MIKVSNRHRHHECTDLYSRIADEFCKLELSDNGYQVRPIIFVGITYLMIFPSQHRSACIIHHWLDIIMPLSSNAMVVVRASNGTIASVLKLINLLLNRFKCHCNYF